MSHTTIYDVAGAAGVSLATVSRVLNSPEKVRPETREKVLRVIKELGYRPNAIARGLASKKTTTVGVVISDTTRTSTASILAGISDIATSYQYSIKVYTIYRDSDLEYTLNGIVADQVDGVLYLNEELTNKEIDRIRKIFDNNQIPYVFANVVTNDPLVPTVSIDYVKAGYEVTKKLIDNGAKDIYLLATLNKLSTSDKQEEGYNNAMIEANLTPKVFRTSEDINVHRQHFSTYFEEKNIDAVIGVRDALAVSFMNTAIEYGKVVPKDLEIVGFQNTMFAILARPMMSAVDIPLYDIGAVSMRLLTKLMTNEGVEQLRVILPYQLMLRQTTK